MMQSHGQPQLVAKLPQSQKNTTAYGSGTKYIERSRAMSAMGQKQTSRHARVMSALPPITDVGRRIQVSIWLSVYEYTPCRLRPEERGPNRQMESPAGREGGGVYGSAGLVRPRGMPARIQGLQFFFLRSGRLVQRRPCGQRIHVIAPAHDLAVLDSGNRDEPVVVSRAVASTFPCTSYSSVTTRPLSEGCTISESPRLSRMLCPYPK